MGEFKLSAALKGHEDDVRSVSFPRRDLVLSASRDASVRTWKLLQPPTYDDQISSTGQAFMNAVTYLPPTSSYVHGLIISGGKDSIIDVREPGKPPDANAERLLLGHEHNICALDVSPDQKWIVSGSWDTTARVWRVDDWSNAAVLEGHQGSVWAVLAYSDELIITACADHLIRVYEPRGKLLNTIKGSTDVVRALCKLPPTHPSKANFASAGNDGDIRLWDLNGRQLAQLQGHESFIYSLGCLPTGEIVSCGEDRTIRVWNQTSCIQTITLPAISVWSIAINADSGDIASGSSDRMVRVFTRDAQRVADAATIAEFDNSIKSSAIPQQQMGDVNKEKLPGPEFLTQKSGTKEGQVAMIREADGSVTAHTWSAAAQQWVNVGTVVDSAASSGKKTEYLGQDYDYVFDVDIEEGKPPLKLPYNLSQNPYEVATKFIQDNELSMTYIDQVANFITTNTQGATLGQGSQRPAAGADPWGTESRYRPGDANAVSEPAPPPQAKRVLPQTEYLSITTANVKMIVKKIGELNDQLLSAGSKDLCLNPAQMGHIQKLGTKLETGPATITASDGLETVSYILTTWPAANLLPVLDMLRLLTAATPAIATQELVSHLQQSGALSDNERPNNQMLGCRALANLFITDAGRTLMDAHFDTIHALVKPLSKAPANRNLTIALATLYINYAVQCSKQAQQGPGMDRGLTLAGDLCTILRREKDSEAIYRSLVALGTLVVLGSEIREACRDVFGVQEALTRAESGVKEPRIKGVAREIRGALDS